jgi:hypothetical protein
MDVPRLRLKHRAAAFYAVAIASFIVVAALVGTTSEDNPALIGVTGLLWLGLVGIVQFVLLQCPHCHQSAILRPRGIATPFVGDTCGHCGKPY